MSSKVPPAAIKIPTKKVRLDELRAAYEWLAVDKPRGFRLAFKWFAENAPLLLKGDPLDAARQKAYDRAVKTRELGDHAGTPAEAIQAWRTTILQYENIVWPAAGLPKVDAYLAAPATKSMAALQTTLGALNNAFAPFHVSYRIGDASDRQFYRNGASATFDLPLAEVTHLATQPPLKTVLDEVPTIAQATSVVTVNGKEELDGTLFMENLPKILHATYAWAATAAGIHTPHLASVPKPPKLPGTPKPPCAPGGGPTVVYMPIKPGSDMEKVLDLITTGQANTIPAIQAVTGWHYHKVTMTISNLRCKAGINFTRKNGRYSI